MRMWKRRGESGGREHAVEMAYRFDHAISEDLAREAAESGSPQAMTVYGIGLGDLGRTDEATHWLEQAAQAGDPLAPAALATLHWDRQDAARAVHWLRMTETTQGALDARISLLRVWARSTVPFDRPPRPAGTPTTDAQKGRAAERGGGLSPADWEEIRQRLGPQLSEDPRMLCLVDPVAMEAEAWFTAAAETARLGVGDALDGLSPTPDNWPVLKEVLSPDDDMPPEHRLAVGALAAQAGDLAAAEEWFAAAARGGDPTALLYRAEVHRDRHGMQRAEPHFKAASDAGSPQAQYALGHWYAERGDHHGAERYYRLAADAGYTDAWLNLGVSLRQLGRLDEAERCCRRAIELGEVADGWNNLGNLMRQRERMGEAEQCWAKAAAAGSGPGMTSLGVCHFGRGEAQEAERLFREAAQTGDPTGMLNLATLLKQTGRMAEAEVWLRRAATGATAGTTPTTATPTPPVEGTLEGTPPPRTPTSDRDAVAQWLSGSEAAGDPAVQEALRRLRRDEG